MKRRAIYIFFILLLTACDCYAKKTNETRVCPEADFCHDTLSINGRKFVRTTDGEATRFYCLTSPAGDTIIPFADYYHQMELMDINEDGATDIRIFIFSNTPNQCDNYLFDKQNGTFRLIENCHLDVRKITGTHLYYSYNAIGCADMNWESYLSTIEGFELTHKGLISGEGCDDVKRIKIYRFAGGEQRQVAELPYTKYIPENDDKWSFIERYWAENHPRFE